MHLINNTILWRRRTFDTFISRSVSGVNDESPPSVSTCNICGKHFSRYILVWRRQWKCYDFVLPIRVELHRTRDDRWFCTILPPPHHHCTTYFVFSRVHGTAYCVIAHPRTIGFVKVPLHQTSSKALSIDRWPFLHGWCVRFSELLFVLMIFWFSNYICLVRSPDTIRYIFLMRKKNQTRFQNCIHDAFEETTNASRARRSLIRSNTFANMLRYNIIPTHPPDRVRNYFRLFSTVASRFRRARLWINDSTNIFCESR